MGMAGPVFTPEQIKHAIQNGVKNIINANENLLLPDDTSEIHDAILNGHLHHSSLFRIMTRLFNNPSMRNVAIFPAFSEADTQDSVHTLVGKYNEDSTEITDEDYRTIHRMDGESEAQITQGLRAIQEARRQRETLENAQRAEQRENLTLSDTQLRLMYLEAMWDIPNVVGNQHNPHLQAQHATHWVIPALAGTGGDGGQETPDGHYYSFVVRFEHTANQKIARIDFYDSAGGAISKDWQEAFNEFFAKRGYTCAFNNASAHRQYDATSCGIFAIYNAFDAVNTLLGYPLLPKSYLENVATNYQSVIQGIRQLSANLYDKKLAPLPVQTQLQPAPAPAASLATAPATSLPAPAVEAAKASTGPAVALPAPANTAVSAVAPPAPPSTSTAAPSVPAKPQDQKYAMVKKAILPLSLGAGALALIPGYGVPLWSMAHIAVGAMSALFGALSNKVIGYVHQRFYNKAPVKYAAAPVSIPAQPAVVTPPSAQIATVVPTTVATPAPPVVPSQPVIPSVQVVQPAVVQPPVQVVQPIQKQPPAQITPLQKAKKQRTKTPEVRTHAMRTRSQCHV